ncbi:MAG: helix-turn-helix domain-containing protein [Anaerolineae bacterium]|nr:helix-turn-helix domain-containing protein [Anaerolineae bacterium]
MNVVTTSIDVKTLLKLALPIGSRLITGRPETPVSWVCNLRPRPPFFPDLEGGELVLVSTNALANHQKPPALEDVIEQLAKAKASALGVRGTLTPHTHRIARAYNFPLIALPDRAILPQVERAVRRLFTNRQAQLAQRAFEIQQTLQRHAASHRGLTTMLNALARIVDRPVVIHDRRGNVLSRGLPASREHEQDSHLALAGGSSFICRFDIEDRAFYEDNWQVIESPAGLTASLVHEGHVLGFVSVLSAGDAPDDFDLLALEYSAPTFARELVHQQNASLRTERTLPTHDWIADWLSNPGADDTLLTLRAEKDNYQPDMWYAVVLFHWVPNNDRSGNTFSPERMVKLIRAELRQRRVHVPVGQYVDRAVLLFPLDEPQQTQRLKQMVDMLHATLSAATPDGEITAGVGYPGQGLSTLRESFKEAERALTIPEQIWDTPEVAFFGDLSLYELLLNIDDAKILSHFCTRWLSKLVEYDAQHRTDLLLTLNAYFENNGNMARTAHVLNIHRNTLVYRMSRITEIIELDMEDPNVRLNLHLALKIQRMLCTAEVAVGAD